MNPWGSLLWEFFHTLSNNIPEKQYPIIKDELMKHIKILCSCLPCPICSEHASQYMKNVRTPETKEGFKQLFVHFHNSVNVRLNKPIFLMNEFEKYKNVNLTYSFHSCKQILLHQPYNPKFSMNKINLQRFLRLFYIWLGKNGLIYK
jgi:hypothetical protein